MYRGEERWQRCFESQEGEADGHLCLRQCCQQLGHRDRKGSAHSQVIIYMGCDRSGVTDQQKNELSTNGARNIDYPGIKRPQEPLRAKLLKLSK